MKKHRGPDLVFRSSSGDFNPHAYYQGSEAGAALLNALDMDRCECGAMVLFDTRAKHVRDCCNKCGREV